jgi:hypothetical protein
VPAYGHTEDANEDSDGGHAITVRRSMSARWRT